MFILVLANRCRISHISLDPLAVLFNGFCEPAQELKVAVLNPPGEVTQFPGDFTPFLFRYAAIEHYNKEGDRNL